MGYKFQKLLTVKFDAKGNASLTGPFSPFYAIKAFSESKGFKPYLGAIRVENNQADNCTYDHIIVRPRINEYMMFVDMGSDLVPVALCFPDKGDVTITPTYKKKTTLEAMEYHLWNMERPVRQGFKLENIEHPIMVLDEKGFLELFKQAAECNLWLKKEDYHAITV